MSCRVPRPFLPALTHAAGLLVLMGFCVGTTPAPAQTPPAAAQPVSHKLNPDELAQLLAPIALYPDALIALILPASTVPSDVVLGARYLAANGNADLAGQQPWDESVKSLLRYPEVLTWLDQNLEWTASVGEAFVEQPADVMNAVQALRQQAKAAGNLQDTPQQRVVVEEQVVRIVPADPQVIYVPVYDPQVVFVQSYSSVPLVTFGFGCAVGAWLAYDFDWNRCRFYHGNWRGWDRGGNHGWNGNHGGNQINVVNINDANPWIPSANGQRQTNQRQRNNNGNARYVGARPAAPQQQADAHNATSPSGPPARLNPGAQSALPRPSQPRRPDGSNEAGHVRPVSPAGTLPSIPLTPDAPHVVPEGAFRPKASDSPQFKKPGAVDAPAIPATTGNEPASVPPQAPLNAPDKPLVPEVTPASQPGTEPPRVAPASPTPSRHSAVPTAAPKIPGQLNGPARNSSQETTHAPRPVHPPTPTTSSPRPTVIPGPAIPLQPAPAAERVIQPAQTRPTDPITEAPAKKTPAARPVNQPKQPAPEVRQEQRLVQPQQQIITEQQRVQPQRQPVVERQIVQPQRQPSPERQLRPVVPVKQQSAPPQVPASPFAAPAAIPSATKKISEDKKAE